MGKRDQGKGKTGQARNKPSERQRPMPSDGRDPMGEGMAVPVPVETENAYLGPEERKRQQPRRGR